MKVKIIPLFLLGASVMAFSVQAQDRLTRQEYIQNTKL